VTDNYHGVRDDHTGDIYDAKGRAPGHVRATPVRFSVVSNQAVHVDFDLDAGIRQGERTRPQYEATRKIAARLRSTSAPVVAHDDTLIRIAV
jgi:hypothetical protein